MDEYAAIYWAAACLVFWAGRGGCNVTGGQLSDAVNMVCDNAKLTLPQEGLLKMLVWNMLKEGAEDAA